MSQQESIATLKTANKKMNSQLAMLNQQLEFATLELENCQQRYAQEKTSWETMLNALDNGNKPDPDLQGKLDKAATQNQVLSSTCNTLTTQLKSAQTALAQQKQVQASLQQQLLQKSQFITQQQTDNLDLMVGNDCLKAQLEAARKELLNKENTFQEEIGKVRRQLESAVDDSQKARREEDSNRGLQSAIAQFKRIIQQQRVYGELLQSRIDEQRLRREKDLSALQKDHKQRMALQSQSHSLELQQLQEHLQTCQLQSQSAIAILQTRHQQQTFKYRQELDRAREAIDSREGRVRKLEESRRRVMAESQESRRVSWELQGVRKEVEGRVARLQDQNRWALKENRSQKQIIAGLEKKIGEIREKHCDQLQRAMIQKQKAELQLQMCKEHLSFMTNEKEYLDDQLQSQCLQYKHIVQKVQQSKAQELAKLQEQHNVRLKDLQELYEQDYDLLQSKTEHQKNLLSQELDTVKEESMFRLKQLQKENKVMSNNLAKDSSYAMDSLRARVAELQSMLKKTGIQRDTLSQQLQAQSRHHACMSTASNASLQAPTRRHKLLLDVSSLSSINS